MALVVIELMKILTIFTQMTFKLEHYDTRQFI